MCALGLENAITLECDEEKKRQTRFQTQNKATIINPTNKCKY